MGVREHAVIIAGGGPAGMMLAGELALAGVDITVLERRRDQVLTGSRAGGFQSRTIEVFDQRGIADRFLAEGRLHRVALFGGSVLDTSDLPTRHPYTVAIWQNEIERIMADWIGELAVHIKYGCEVTEFEQDDGGVDVHLADGRSLRAQYLVGCDGGRSLIRRVAGIEFPGWDPTRSNLIAEVEMRDGPDEDVLRHDATGVHGLHKMEDGRTFRVVVTERQIGPSSEPTLRDLSEALITVFGTDYGAHRPTWISRFTDMTRQAAAYRDRRVLLAGDAAHIHYPAGGQGLSLGVQDAVNLGWKLAQVVKGISPESLLDTYHAERHPVGARVLRHTMAQATLQRRDDRTQALVDVISEMASMEEPRRHIAALMTGLDIHYELGEGHPLLGRRMPDLDADHHRGCVARLRAAARRQAAGAQPGRPRQPRHRRMGRSSPADRREPRRRVGTPGHRRGQRPHAQYWFAQMGTWRWVGSGAQQGLPEALTSWFGPPTAT